MNCRLWRASFFLALPLLVMLLSPAVTWAEGVAIGVILPMSGTHAAFGHMQKNSMVLAMEEINSRGGINGELLELDVRDSGGQTRKARVIVDHFVNDKQYAVVLGGFSSSVAAALADKCEQMRIPLIVVTGSEDAVTLKNYRYVFRVSPPRSRYPAAALDFNRSVIDGKRIILITEQSVYGDTIARTVKQAAREARWTVSGEWKFEMGSRNLESLYSRAVAAEPDAIFLTAFPPDGPKIITELRESIPNAAFFNLTPASTMAGSYAQCGLNCEGVMNPSLWFPEAGKSAIRYRDSYLARFETEPDYHGAQAYGAVMVAAQAIRRSGVAQAEPVRDALEGISVNTPYGKISFRQWGGFANQNDPANYLFQWTGSSFEVLWPEEFKTADTVLPGGQ
jgi:branched-chain amino acid transport system substrate-binding protein